MLAAIAHTSPVVATFDTGALQLSPEDVCDTYSRQAATYVEQPVLAAFRERFIDGVREAKAPKACLVAPFGYGKTATTIGLWQACQEAGLLAVPPVSCTSFADLARAVHDWLVFALPEVRDETARAHEAFLARSADALARRDEQLFGIPRQQAAAAIRDKLERGYLDFEDASINLVTFLETAAGIVRQAGRAGLVVLVDEFQQLLGNANKGILVSLRQLVWGLRTRHIPLGLLVTMDPDTERTLADRAGDILHRIKDDGLYLDIRHIYDREFPARLWEQYATALALPPHVSSAIDRPALDALGQLCERDDLSNGPRTVINVLQRVASVWERGKTVSYTPICLIDDLVSGAVRFDGDRSVVPALVAELLNFPYFQRSPARAQALKLIAAFPRGCPRTLAARYGLDSAWMELNDDLRGEIVTELDEGLALIELQRVGRPANRLNVLLRRYWMQITDQTLFNEDAPRVFAETILPLLFPPKVHDLNGWSTEQEVQLAPDGTYRGIVQGTSSVQYPLRRIALTVNTGSSVTRAADDDRDLDIVFLLDLSPDAKSSLRADATTGHVVLSLALFQVASTGLAGGLAWIEHYLSPHPISPAVVLNLVRYLTDEVGDVLSERDRVRIEDALARLREWLLQELLPQSIFASAGFDVVQGGLGGFREFLYLLATHRWPHYKTLAVHQHWLSLMQDYEAALAAVPPRVRAGAAPWQDTKATVAAAFRQMRHAGFDSRARQYGSLLRLEAWRGSEAVVRFVPHPAELDVANEVRREGVLPYEQAYQHLRGQGFSVIEARLILRLAVARGLITEQEGGIASPKTLSELEIVERTQCLMTRWTALGSGSIGTPKDLTTLNDAIKFGQLDRSEAEWQLDKIEQEIQRVEAEAQEAMRIRAQAMRVQLVECLADLAPALPMPAQSELKNHLTAVYSRLCVHARELTSLIENVGIMEEDSTIRAGERLLAQVAAWRETANLYCRWNETSARVTRIEAALKRASDLKSLADLLLKASAITRDMRAVLAQEGLDGLTEIGRFEASVVRLEQEFEGMENERAEAYITVARRLFAEVAELMNLPMTATFPAYKPADDDGSFDALQDATYDFVRRSLVLMTLEVTGGNGAKQEKLARAKLRADLRALARTLQRDSLISKPQFQIADEAARALRGIRERVARLAASDVGEGVPIGVLLVRTLSDLPTAAVDLGLILDRIDGSADRVQLINELVKLQEEGVLRLTLSLPE